MMTEIELADLAAALDVERGELISLIGGGGKTTTLFALGAQLAGTTVLTTTTKMGADQSFDHPTLIDPSDAELVAELARTGRVLAWKGADQRRAIGVSAAKCDRWFDLADNVVAEADGSRKRPFKAPAEHEPVIPSRTTLVVACVGAGALGQPIEACCHRPDIVASIAQCGVHDVLTPGRAAAVLLSERGSKRGLPPEARFAIAVCRVNRKQRAAIAELAEILGPHHTAVAVRELTSD